MMETFFVSLTVSLLSIWLAIWQTRVVTSLILKDADVLQVPVLVEKVEKRIGHAIDISVNMPTTILTLVAATSLKVSQHLPSWVLILITVLLCLVFFALGRPRAAGLYWLGSLWGKVSLMSLLLVVANTAGLVLSIGERTAGAP